MFVKRVPCPSLCDTGLSRFSRAAMGAHNDEIHGNELGFSKERLKQLKEAGII